MRSFVKILFFSLIFIHFSLAQVGVNTTDPQAVLDVRSSNQATPANNDGILIPKADNFPSINPTAAQDGMLLYLTGAGTPAKGFYFWEQSSSNWRPIGRNAGWATDGNAGTNSGTNFIGTADAQDLSFRTNNVNKMRLSQKGQLEFVNMGNSIFIGDRAGENDDLSDNKNVFIGRQSGDFNTSGFHNTFIGYATGLQNVTGINNSFFGTQAGESNNGSSNSFFGSFSGNDSTSGSFNSFFGTSAGGQNNTGGSNSFFGQQAGFGNTTGSFNVGVGSGALAFNQTGNNNVSIGTDAGRGTSTHSKTGCVFIGHLAGREENNSNRLYIENSNSASPLIYGEFDNDVLRVNGSFQVNNPAITGYSLPNTDGTAGQVLQTDGNGAITFVDAPDADTEWSKIGNAGTNSATDFIGTTDAQDLSFRTNNVNKMHLTQKGQLEFINTGNSVFIGDRAGENDDLSANENVFIGYQSGQSNSTGFDNTFVGFQSGFFTNNGDNNSFFGSRAGEFAQTSNNSTGIGYSALSNSGGLNNVAIGSNAGSMLSLGSLNTFIGAETMGGTLRSLSGSVFIGYQAGFLENSNNRLYIENSSSATPLIYGEFDNDILRVYGTIQVNNPTATGYSLPITDGSAGQVLQTDGNGAISFVNSNTIGVQQINDLLDGISDNDGSNNGSSIFLGLNSGVNDDASNNLNVGVGINTLNSNTTGAGNIAIGASALSLNVNTNNNTALGNVALRNNIAQQNTAVGSNSLADNTTGESNTATGYLAMGDNTTGNSNTAIGRSSMRLNSIGSENVAVGQSALFNATGNQNTAIGRSALSGVTSGSNNTALGYNAQVPIAAGSNQVRIGDTNVTAATIQVPWTITSDSYWKENIRDLSYGLDVVNALKPVDYLRKNNDANTREVGFIAQDVKALLQLLELTDLGIVSEDDNDRLGLRYNDFIPILVKAIQEQDAKIKSLEERLEALEQD